MLEQKTTAFQPAKKTPVAPVPEVEAPQPEEAHLVTCLYCGAQSSVDRETCFACSCVLKR